MEFDFSQGQDLLVRFGCGSVFNNPYTMECLLAPPDSTGLVSVTLHRQDLFEIQNENDVKFTYEDVDKELSVHDKLCACLVLTLSSPESPFLTESLIIGD